MTLIKLNNKLIKLNNKLEVLNPIIQNNGVLNFNNASYVTLASNPDLSGSKTLKWKMWIDPSVMSSSWLFSLGSDANSLQVYEESGALRLGNRNRTYSGNGERRILINTGMTGYILDCFAVKTTTEILWYQIGGYASGDQNLGSSGSPPTTVSRIGSNGTVPIQNGCKGMYVWNIEVDDSGGTALGAWSGYGVAPNTSDQWVDTIGSDNGTITGTGLIKTTVTNPPLYTDWFLPSKDELTAMYDNLKVTGYGNFNTSQAYWTSSEYNSTDAWAILFSNRTIIHVPKTGTYGARAARSFTAGVGAYNLTDLGPAGGRIFYIDGGTTYYEAAPTDNLYGQAAFQGGVWMNLTGFGIGPATGTAIGTGITNTPLIIAATGHKYSAAGVCHSLSVKM